MYRLTCVEALYFGISLLMKEATMKIPTVGLLLNPVNNLWIINIYWKELVPFVMFCKVLSVCGPVEVRYIVQA